MATKIVKSQTTNILIKTDGEGDWSAKKEKINGKKTIVFFRSEGKPSLSQKIKNSLNNVMSGTEAANKYLKKMDINQQDDLFKNLKDPKKKRITQESLNQHIENLFGSRNFQRKSDDQINHYGTQGDNVFFENIKFEGTKNSQPQNLKLIDKLIENNGGDKINLSDKQKIIRYVNLSSDNSYQNKSIKEQNAHQKECAAAKAFLNSMKISDPNEKKYLAQLTNRLTIIENTKPTSNPQYAKMKLEIAAAYIEEFGSIKSDKEIQQFIKFIDIATYPPEHNLSPEEKSQFKKLCADAKLNLTYFSKTLEHGSELQHKLFKLIGNLNVALDGTRGNTEAEETKKFLTNSIFIAFSLNHDKKIKRQAINLAVDNYYGVINPKKSDANIKNLSDSRLELNNIRTLLQLDTEKDTKPTVKVLSKMIEALDETITRLQAS